MYQLRLILQQRFYTVRLKPEACIIVIKYYKIIKYLTIQRENVNRGHAATIIARNVQNGIYSSVTSSIVCTPIQTVLRRCCSWSSRCFKNHSKWSSSIILLQILSRDLLAQNLQTDAYFYKLKVILFAPTHSVISVVWCRWLQWK